MIFPAITIAILLGYSLLILSITAGWWRLKNFKRSGKSVNVKVSIVVAVRNEASNIQSLLNSLLNQDYPKDLSEIIIVDDHSTDMSIQIVEEIISTKHQDSNVKIIRLSDKSTVGKKAAISEGIKDSSGELIVITDADCTACTSWISTISDFYHIYRPKMILGPVQMTDGGSFWCKLQSLEFMSLISSAAGSCNAGFPLLANGANIAFTRQAYDGCSGFNENMQYTSGDDMFLMLNIKEKFGAKAIRFLRSGEAIVSTPSVNGLKPFIQQRLRWVSKSRGYRDPFLIEASMIVFLVNFWLIITAFSAMFFVGYLKFFFLMYLVKLVVDLPLILSFGRFQQRGKLLVLLFPVMELLNAVYTVFIGIIGNFAKYEWKGRTISTKYH